MESKTYGILGGDLGNNPDFQRPFDTDGEVVPSQCSFNGDGVRFGAFVVKIGRFTHHEKSVGATGRHPKTLMRIGCKEVSVPDAKRRRTLSEVNDGIEDGARRHPNQFTLSRVACLIVETTQNVPTGAAVVILNEVQLETKVAKCRPVPRLEKKASFVAEYGGFQEPRIVNFCWIFFHLSIFQASGHDGFEVGAVAGFAER